MKYLFSLYSFLLTICLAANTHAAIDADLLSGMKARAIGPAATSGRITDIEVVVNQPNIMYAGTATGGLWKSVNSGLNWRPIFDDQDYASIGAIAINQSNPDEIWVGTGEGNVRNSTSYGGGIYKSIDAGKTWTLMGLAKTERINRIAIDPTNPNIVYVAALGTLWSENTDRGIYKTEDGGKTWKKILYVDQKTGGTDIKMDPQNPNKLYAAMWQFRRWPYRFESGGKGSGLYISFDGGNSWTQKTEDDGLPKGELGRIVIATAKSNPNRVYALVEAKKSALVRSDDGGHSWSEVNKETKIADRPFYYSELEVDPQNENIVYNLATFVRRSIDGGKTFTQIESVNCCAAGNTIHIDTHSLWINPQNSKHMILGNDGGLAITRDKASTWRYVQNLPVSQFYHIRVDDAHPYNIYGGLQDNGTWRGPSEIWKTAGIRSLHWQEIAFGDGFDAMPFPDNNEAGYAMFQGGNLMTWDINTGEQSLIKPNMPIIQNGKEVELRFNWSSALAQDPFNNDTIYYGSQFVHKSTNRGASWETISGDLTTNNPKWQKFKDSGGLTPDVTAAENFTSIVSIAPSTVQQGVIWVGTDDGRVHVTRDGGKTWRSIENKAKGVPKNTWVPHIEPSPHDAGTAFIVFDNHRRGDMQTYVQRIDKFGAKFTSLATKNLRGYALSIQQDHVDPNLIFLGTELGLYVTTDGGRQWFKYTAGVPTVSVMDMAIQERENDLVLGTHGRSTFVLDDYSALRGLNQEHFSKKLALLSVTDGQQYIRGRSQGTRFWGDGAFVGENEPYGVVLTLMAAGDFLKHPDEDKEKIRSKTQRVKEAAKKEEANKKDSDNNADENKNKSKEKKPTSKARIEVSDASGRVIRTFVSELQQGINRIVWDLKLDGVRPTPENIPKKDKDIMPPSQFEAIPGEYSLKVTLNEESFSAKARILIDPRIDSNAEALSARNGALEEVLAMENLWADMVYALDDHKKDVELIKAKAQKVIEQAQKDAQENHPLKELTKKADKLLKKIKKHHKNLRTLPDTNGIVDDSYTLASYIGFAYFAVASDFAAPTSNTLEFIKKAKQETAKRRGEVNKLINTEIQDFRKAFDQSDLGLLKKVKAL